MSNELAVVTETKLENGVIVKTTSQPGKVPEIEITINGNVVITINNNTAGLNIIDNTGTLALVKPAVKQLTVEEKMDQIRETVRRTWASDIPNPETPFLNSLKQFAQSEKEVTQVKTESSKRQRKRK